MRGKKFVFNEEQIKDIIENCGKEIAHSMKKRFGCSWCTVASLAKANSVELPTSNERTKEQIEMLKSLAEGCYHKCHYKFHSESHF